MLNQKPDPRAIGTLHVAELARLADVTPATVRYYSRVGLLSPQREPANGYRRFSVADHHRVDFIRRAQSLGLTIGDIKTILEIIDLGGAPCHQVRSLVEERFRSVQERLAELKATEARITQALATWDDMSSETPGKGELCPLIDCVSPSGESTSGRSACRSDGINARRQPAEAHRRASAH